MSWFSERYRTLVSDAEDLLQRATEENGRLRTSISREYSKYGVVLYDMVEAPNFVATSLIVWGLRHLAGGEPSSGGGKAAFVATVVALTHTRQSLPAWLRTVIDVIIGVVGYWFPIVLVVRLLVMLVIAWALKVAAASISRSEIEAGLNMFVSYGLIDGQSDGKPPSTSEVWFNPPIVVRTDDISHHVVSTTPLAPDVNMAIPLQPATTAAAGIASLGGILCLISLSPHSRKP